MQFGLLLHVQKFVSRRPNIAERELQVVERLKKETPAYDLGPHGDSIKGTERLVEQVRKIQAAMRDWEIEVELASEKAQVARLCAFLNAQRLMQIPDASSLD
uniref:Uncharacterized protein n=1 Tax=Mycena chlorophos TaxID=658473 RepID=A0ABQ0M4C7_MYCCL|nr:predicted protein [Mycena chlorophos]